MPVGADDPGRAAAPDIARACHQPGAYISASRGAAVGPDAAPGLSQDSAARDAEADIRAAPARVARAPMSATGAEAQARSCSPAALREVLHSLDLPAADTAVVGEHPPAARHTAVAAEAAHCSVALAVRPSSIALRFAGTDRVARADKASDGACTAPALAHSTAKSADVADAPMAADAQVASAAAAGFAVLDVACGAETPQAASSARSATARRSLGAPAQRAQVSSESLSAWLSSPGAADGTAESDKSTSPKAAASDAARVDDTAVHALEALSSDSAARGSALHKRSLAAHRALLSDNTASANPDPVCHGQLAAPDAAADAFEPRHDEKDCRGGDGAFTSACCGRARHRGAAWSSALCNAECEFC